MAIRIYNSISQTNTVKALPTFPESSKMNLYEIFFDTTNNNEPTAGFIKTFSQDKLNSVQAFKFVVTAEFEHRIDLISYKFFRSTTRDWIIELVNNIKDPIKDIYVGKVLYIPTDSFIFENGGLVV